MSDTTTTVMWFRRDLRLSDNTALLDACAADGVLPLFVLAAGLLAFLFQDEQPGATATTPAAAPRRKKR